MNKEEIKGLLETGKVATEQNNLKGLQNVLNNIQEIINEENKN